MGGFTYAHGISTVDLSGNGHLDLVAVDTNVGLYWFENHGGGAFTRHIIHRQTPQWLERHVIADINADGQPEIVCVDNVNGSLLWFEFEGDPRDPRSWKPHYICDGQLPGAYDVAVADFDGDGQMDVAASSWSLGNQFAWFQNCQGQWIKHIIDRNISETRTIRAADIDGDGRIDLLGTAFGGNQVLWYQNTGDPTHGGWVKHVIDTAAQPCHGQPVDIDGDGDVDVVMALGMRHVPGTQGPVPHQIVWYENDGNPGDGPWKKHVICESFPSAYEAVAADLDGDGQVEVVATAIREGQVVVFKHAGDPTGPWSMQILKENWINVNQVVVADLVGDGRPDIVACAERGSNEVRWWRNLGPTATPSPVIKAPGRTLKLGGGVTIDLAQIPKGRFHMGSDETMTGRPVRRVTIDQPFDLSRHPITQGQWKQVMGERDFAFCGEDLPADPVSWHDATEFCQKISSLVDRLVCLPSEAQWEYACRAGTSTRYYFGDGADALGEYAWFTCNSNRMTHPVGKKKPNSFGLYDMHGNVWEWCQDVWHHGYDGVPLDATAWMEGGDQKVRVIRGGNWCANADSCRAGYRCHGAARSINTDGLGFRVVVE